MAAVTAGKLQVYGLLVGTEPGTGPTFPQGSVISRIKVFTLTTTDAATVAAVTTVERTYAVTGVIASDAIFGWNLAAAPPSLLTLANVRVSAGNLIVAWANAAAATAIAPGTFTLQAFAVNVDTA